MIVGRPVPKQWTLVFDEVKIGVELKFGVIIYFIIHLRVRVR